MTETSPPNTISPLGSNKIESIGRAVPWLEVRIVDEEDRELSVSEVGELLVRGWVVMEGYYKEPELTRQAIKDGWFHTGDLARIDSEGFIYIVGRKGELIKVGGERVFAPEVETVIHRHPSVSEVAVVGVSDRFRGEVPKAFLVAKKGKTLTEDELRYFCRKHLAHFKIPHYFEFKDSLPKTRSGKIDKASLEQL
jgi:acyl-CoA synthetase (AMP-forming)/AMP-acid ligase II